MALRLAEMPDLETTMLEGAEAEKCFEMPSLSGSWQRCLEGLQHPYTGKIRPITFDHEVAKDRDDVVLVHLNHRLVQMSLRVLRAQIWISDEARKGLNRIAVRTLPDKDLSEPAVLVISRLVIVGGNHHRLHEELTQAGGYLRDNGFRREDRVTNVSNLLKSARPAKVSNHVSELLTSRFAKSRDSVMDTVSARSKDRLRNLANTIDNRRNQEIKNIRQVLDDLETSLTEELINDSQPQQLSLFSEDERLQLTRDVSALEARLERIPEEKEAETRAIEARHANATDHTFPVAIIFVVPESMTERGAL